MKFMNLCKIFSIVLLLSFSAHAEPDSLLQNPFKTGSDYETLRSSLVSKYSDNSPKEWGEDVSGVKTRIKGSQKLIALTFDACGSTHGMRYDKTLIDYLRKERIPATLFINGRWIAANRAEFDRLAADSLFEIANHGQHHRPASVNGRSVYGISGTKDVGQLVDEIELNARKLLELTGKRPQFYRSGTAYYDEVAVKISQELGHKVAGFSLLGDAGATYSRGKVASALLAAKPGDIAILHFNHPESGTAAGIMDAIPELRKRGFRFVRLSDVELE